MLAQIKKKFANMKALVPEGQNKPQANTLSTPQKDSKKNRFNTEGQSNDLISGDQQVKMKNIFKTPNVAQTTGKINLTNMQNVANMGIPTILHNGT